jgi:hypothetical protein
MLLVDEKLHLSPTLRERERESMREYEWLFLCIYLMKDVTRFTSECSQISLR